MNGTIILGVGNAATVNAAFKIVKAAGRMVSLLKSFESPCLRLMFLSLSGSLPDPIGGKLNGFILQGKLHNKLNA